MTEKGICPIQTVFGILGGKWKHRILLELHPGPMRYNQLAANIGRISYKVLTQQLREGLSRSAAPGGICSHRNGGEYLCGVPGNAPLGSGM